MTIKEMEQQVGITKANIRFYESEGLLNPGRKANNYREYSAEDVELLKKIKCLRTLGISVSDIRMVIHGEITMEQLMDGRIQEIEAEKEELVMAQAICRDLKEHHTAYESLEPSTLTVKMGLLKAREKQMAKQDKRDKIGQLRRAAMTWCMICIASMVIIPINLIFRIEMPPAVQNIYILVVMLSPLPYYLISMIGNRDIMDDSDLYLPKRKQDHTAKQRPDKWDGLERFHQLCLVSLVIIPLNQIFQIQWPGGLTVVWVLVIAGSTAAVTIKRNHTR